MEDQKIRLEDFYAELIAAVNVCFEGKTQQENGTIVYIAPNGQQFRITAERIS